MEISLSKPALCQREVMGLKEPKEPIKFDHWTMIFSIIRCYVNKISNLSKNLVKQTVNFFKEWPYFLLYFGWFLSIFCLLFLFLLVFWFFLQSTLCLFSMFLEIFVLKFNKQFISDFDNFIDLYMLFYILKMLEDSCKVIVDNHIFARHYNGNCEKVYELKMILWRKDTLPYPQSIKKVEILSIQQSHPSKAVEKWINF